MRRIDRESPRNAFSGCTKSLARLVCAAVLCLPVLRTVWAGNLSLGLPWAPGEIAGEISRAGAIYKWTTSVGAQLIGEADGELSEYYERVLSDVREKAKIDVEDLNFGTFEIAVLNKQQMKGTSADVPFLKSSFGSQKYSKILSNIRADKSPGCSGEMDFDNGRIENFYAVIDGSIEAPRQRQCIAEMLLTGLGLVRGEDMAYDSIVSKRKNRPIHVLLSQDDVLLLKVLYDPNITPGSSPKQALDAIYSKNIK